jgi:hypothetical protein
MQISTGKYRKSILQQWIDSKKQLIPGEKQSAPRWKEKRHPDYAECLT